VFLVSATWNPRSIVSPSTCATEDSQHRPRQGGPAGSGQRRFHDPVDEGRWRLETRVAVEARGDFGSIEGLVSRLQSAEMKSIVAENPTDMKHAASTNRPCW
jgi:hypothetical protein